MGRQADRRAHPYSFHTPTYHIGWSTYQRRCVQLLLPAGPAMPCVCLRLGRMAWMDVLMGLGPASE